MVLNALPAPAAGSVRRTLSLHTTPAPEWAEGLRIAGTARDLVVGAGRSRVSATRELAVTLDARSRITDVTGEVSRPDALIGASPVSGFRAHLAGLPEPEPSSLESALLDDLPTVRLVSGYALMMEMPELARAGGRSPLIGICGGWAPGASADTRTRAGVPLLESAPPSPPLAQMLAGPGDFHPEPAMCPRSMRRRRVLDVAARPGGYDVFEYFRDSYFDPDGREGSLHEYEVHARVAGDGATLEHIEVVPHALPFPECPLVAPNAGDLAGISLAGVTTEVKARLSGTRGCTHLNDTLRFLRYVPALAATL